MAQEAPSDAQILWFYVHEILTTPMCGRLRLRHSNLPSQLRELHRLMVILNPGRPDSRPTLLISRPKNFPISAMKYSSHIPCPIQYCLIYFPITHIQVSLSFSFTISFDLFHNMRHSYTMFTECSRIDFQTYIFNCLLKIHRQKRWQKKYLLYLLLVISEFWLCNGRLWKRAMFLARLVRLPASTRSRMKSIASVRFRTASCKSSTAKQGKCLLLRDSRPFKCKTSQVILREPSGIQVNETSGEILLTSLTEAKLRWFATAIYCMQDCLIY